MAANNLPIYTKRWDITTDWTTWMAPTLTTATGDYTGVSANHKLVHTAGADGSMPRYLLFNAIWTNTASVARIYFNNGSTNGTATNNELVGQLSLPATTATNTASTQMPVFQFAEWTILPAWFKIYVGLGTTVASGWVCTCIAWQY